MAYCTELEALDALPGGVTEKSETFSSVDNGDDMDLSNTKFLIPKAFTTTENSELSSDQDVIVTDSSGNLQSTSDYTVDLRDGVVTNDSMGTGDYTVRSKVAPVPGQVVTDVVADMTAHIDEKTHTTFDGVTTVTGEIYDGTGEQTAPVRYAFRARPVQDVTSVEVNEASLGDTDDWVTRTEGRDSEWVQWDDMGVTFVDGDAAPGDVIRSLRVTYTYGYSTIPNTVRRLCILLSAVHLAKNTQYGALIEGKDNFDPETLDRFKREIDELFNHWSVMRFGSDANLAETGTES